MVADDAVIGPACRIDAYAIIGPEVRLGTKVHVKPHATLTGSTRVGDGTVVFSYACVGEVPQDLKYRGEKTELIIGSNNRIREGVTMNTGTAHGGGVTKVGDDCLFMTGAHVGHDVVVGNGVVLANNVAIGGHCKIDDHVIIGGLAGIHQHVRIGKGAIIGALTMVRRDVIPYGHVQGSAGELQGINIIGLRRRGVSNERITELRKAYDRISGFDGTFVDMIKMLDGEDLDEESLVRDVIEFARASSGRKLLMPHQDS